ncbi:MAG: NAD+ synthase [Bdellovibrionaceae bacterium]|nr:NAD+ synthase [Pseudobdellovibrionaceae bacterium]|tara:strand:- start:28980 stop:30617 length:1638 start_codon:yes stop_codon:yes gene_type:complete
MKVSLAQINSCLGQFSYNADRMVRYAQKAKNNGSDLVIFPECSLTGYHPVDLLERDSVVEAQLKELERLAKRLPKDIGVFVGAITRNEKPGKNYFNSAVFIYRNKIQKIFHKELLPTYDVFDEARHITPGETSKNIFRFKGFRILTCICEDIWAWTLPGESEKQRYHTNPIKKIKDKNIDLIVNLSASPFHTKKWNQRKFVTEKCASHLRAPMIYVNMVGAQDELIYDGGSFAIDKKGRRVAQASRYKEDLVSFEIEPKTKKVKSGQKRIIRVNRTSDIYNALVLGVRDFVNKVGFQRVHLGLSGGIDSAVVAAIAADAIGSEKLTCIALPSKFNSPKSLSSAKTLAKNLNCEFIEMPIQELYECETKLVDQTFGKQKFSIVHENLQARTRGMLLMTYSNLNHSLLINTSNKSELAMGYSTLYGDQCGGLCPIGDLLKTEVVKLAEYINRNEEIIPRFIIDRPPSAELRKNQKDEDSLPKYDVLDKAVTNLVIKTKKPKGELERRVLKSMMQSEFKRWQAPPILKVSDHAFGRGRRLPVAHKAFY